MHTAALAQRSMHFTFFSVVSFKSMQSSGHNASIQGLQPVYLIRQKNIDDQTTNKANVPLTKKKITEVCRPVMLKLLIKNGQLSINSKFLAAIKCEVPCSVVLNQTEAKCTGCLVSFVPWNNFKFHGFTSTLRLFNSYTAPLAMR